MSLKINNKRTRKKIFALLIVMQFSQFGFSQLPQSHLWVSIPIEGDTNNFFEIKHQYYNSENKKVRIDDFKKIKTENKVNTIKEGCYFIYEYRQGSMTAVDDHIMILIKDKKSLKEMVINGPLEETRGIYTEVDLKIDSFKEGVFELQKTLKQLPAKNKISLKELKIL